MTTLTRDGETIVIDARHIVLSAERVLSKIRTTPIEVEVLSFVDRMGGMTESIVAIARSIDVSNVAMTHVINRMERKELVVRLISMDRRAVRVQMTERGRLMLATARAALDDMVNENTV